MTIGVTTSLDDDTARKLEKMTIRVELLKSIEHIFHQQGLFSFRKKV